MPKTAGKGKYYDMLGGVETLQQCRRAQNDLEIIGPEKEFSCLSPKAEVRVAENELENLLENMHKQIDNL